MIKHCVTCKQDGHTYLECTVASFGDLFAAALGMSILPSGKTREQLAADLANIDASPPRTEEQSK